MKPETRRYLADILRAAGAIREFTSSIEITEYPIGAMQRSAVERQFIIIGEAVRRITPAEPGVADGISRRQGIVNFRNVLVHDYRRVRNSRVCLIMQTALPRLVSEVEVLLEADAAE